MGIFRKKKVVAVDLGGTNLRVALVEDSKVINYVKKKTPKTKRELLNRLFWMMGGFMSKDVKGIAVSSAGPLKDGTIRNPPNLPLKNFNLKKALQDRFKVRAEVKNDADCVAFAEAKLGCRKKNFFILTLGTGIGGGLIINGELYRGGGYAGELGHIIIDNGKDFETMWKLSRNKCRKYFGEKLLIKDLLRINSKKAKEILEDSAKYLGQGIGSLINVFDPEVVIISGGVRETGNKFLSMIRKQTRKYTLIPSLPKIEWSELEHPGIIGASLYF